MDEAAAGRVIYLVSHHHTVTGVDGADYQILLEADYIANAEENHWPEENVRRFLSSVAGTESGKRLIRGDPSPWAGRGGPHAGRTGLRIRVLNDMMRQILLRPGQCGAAKGILTDEV